MADRRAPKARRRVCWLVAVAAVGAASIASPASALAAITVTNTGDGVSTCPSAGHCTLRGAIATASSGGTVSVPAGNYTTNGSTNSNLVVSKNLTIAGAGAAATSVSGVKTGSVHRVFLISGAGVTVTISGLTIKNGKLDATSTDCDGSNAEGGGVCVLSGAQLTLKNDVVTANTVDAGS